MVNKAEVFLKLLCLSAKGFNLKMPVFVEIIGQADA